MVKLIKKIEQASPLCMCKNPNSFDYNDYYKKKYRTVFIHSQKIKHHANLMKILKWIIK